MFDGNLLAFVSQSNVPDSFDKYAHEKTKERKEKIMKCMCWKIGAMKFRVSAVTRFPPLKRLGFWFDCTVVEFLREGVTKLF